MKHFFSHNGQKYEIDVALTSNGYRVMYEGEELEIMGRDSDPGKVVLVLKDRTVTLHVATDRNTRWVAFDGKTYALRKESRSRRRGRGEETTEGLLHAPMPGQVRDIYVAEGDTVEKGATLMLLEAMKMEIRIQSPSDGVVTKIPVTVGEQVEKEQSLIEIK